MLEKIRVIYRKTIPYSIRGMIGKPIDYWKGKRRFSAFCKKMKTEKWMKIHKEECKYLIKEGVVHVFPYPWIKEYRTDDIKVYYDREKRMRYVIVAGEVKMYFPRYFSDSEVRRYFNSILVEQDERSPHYYFEASDEKIKDSIFLDIGGAEGYITLLILPFVKRAVIFESDECWGEALEATFGMFSDKVSIIHRFAGAKSHENTIKIDDVVKEADNVVLKIDVEGMEKEVLLGAQKTLDKPNTKIYICVYHNQNDEKEIGGILKQHNFKMETTDGWMLFGTNSDLGFRRGILRAWKGKL